MIILLFKLGKHNSQILAPKFNAKQSRFEQKIRKINNTSRDIESINSPLVRY